MMAGMFGQNQNGLLNNLFSNANVEGGFMPGGPNMFF